jgi:hypothetical protein
MMAALSDPDTATTMPHVFHLWLPHLDKANVHSVSRVEAASENYTMCVSAINCTKRDSESLADAIMHEDELPLERAKSSIPSEMPSSVTL